MMPDATAASETAWPSGTLRWLAKALDEAREESPSELRETARLVAFTLRAMAAGGGGD